MLACQLIAFNYYVKKYETFMIRKKQKKFYFLFFSYNLFHCKTSFKSPTLCLLLYKTNGFILQVKNLNVFGLTITNL